MDLGGPFLIYAPTLSISDSIKERGKLSILVPGRGLHDSLDMLRVASVQIGIFVQEAFVVQSETIYLKSDWEVIVLFVSRSFHRVDDYGGLLPVVEHRWVSSVDDWRVGPVHADAAVLVISRTWTDQSALVRLVVDLGEELDLVERFEVVHGR